MTRCTPARYTHAHSLRHAHLVNNVSSTTPTSACSSAPTATAWQRTHDEKTRNTGSQTCAVLRHMPGYAQPHYRTHTPGKPPMALKHKDVSSTITGPPTFRAASCRSGSRGGGGGLRHWCGWLSFPSLTSPVCVDLSAVRWSVCTAYEAPRPSGWSRWQ